MATGSNIVKKRTTLMVMITVLFFFWGLANNMTDALLTAFRSILDMSGFQTYLIKSAFYVSYFVVAVPAALYIFKYSYKSAIITGLILYALGAMLFFPAASSQSYYFYLIAVYVMAAGCAFLETTANPYILSLSDNHDISIRKLNLAQSFNPWGSLLGILIINSLINSTMDNSSAKVTNPEVLQEELDTITMVYALLGELLLLALVIILFTYMPVSERINFSQNKPKVWPSMKRLFTSKRYVAGLVAELLYIGAQVGVWAYASSTLVSMGICDSAQAQRYFIMSMVLFGVMRFVFTFLMRKHSWKNLLLVASILAFVLTLTVLFSEGGIVAIAMVGISGCMSLMFPTIYGAALEKTGSDMQLGGAFLVVTLIGGALILPLQNTISETLTSQMSFIVPAFCFLALIGYSGLLIWMDKKK